MGVSETLAARAEALLNSLAQAKAQAASQQAHTEITTACTRANKVAIDLREALRAIPLLADGGVSVHAAVPNSTLQDVTRARKALRSSASSMVGAQAEDVASRVRSQSVDAALAVSEKLARSVLASLNRTVDHWRQELLPTGIDERIVAYPGTSEALAVKLRNVQGRLQRKVENLTAGQLAQRVQEITADVAIWTAERPRLNTGLEGRHPDVQEFLRQAAAEQGASWDLMTPVVVTWLEDPENTVNLRVVLRS
jgi:hypothetical protein